MTQGSNTVDYFEDSKRYETKGSTKYLYPIKRSYSEIIGYVKYYTGKEK